MIPHLFDDDLKEFQTLWKQETGQKISLATAREYATDILGLVEIVASPRAERQPDQA